MEKVILIQKPIDQVFEYVADCRNSKGYLGRSFHFEAVTPPPFGVGTKAAAIGSFMNIPIRLNYVITEYELNRLILLQAPRQNLNGIPVNSWAQWRFKASGPNATLVGFDLTIQPQLGSINPFGKMMAGSIIRSAEASVSRMLDKALFRLKETLEHAKLAEVAR